MDDAVPGEEAHVSGGHKPPGYSVIWPMTITSWLVGMAVGGLSCMQVPVLALEAAFGGPSALQLLASALISVLTIVVNAFGLSRASTSEDPRIRAARALTPSAIALTLAAAALWMSDGAALVILQIVPGLTLSGWLPVAIAAWFAPSLVPLGGAIWVLVALRGRATLAERPTAEQLQPEVRRGLAPKRMGRGVNRNVAVTTLGLIGGAGAILQGAVSLGFAYFTLLWVFIPVAQPPPLTPIAIRAATGIVFMLVGGLGIAGAAFERPWAWKALLIGGAGYAVMLVSLPAVWLPPLMVLDWTFVSYVLGSLIPGVLLIVAGIIKGRATSGAVTS